MFTSVHFENFKGLNKYSVSLKDMNVLVGPNNAGKSSILDAFRLLSAGLKHARRNIPKFITVNEVQIYGYDIPQSTLPVSLTNIHSNYRDDIPTRVTFRLENGNRLELSFYESSRCVMRIETERSAPRNTSQFQKEFPVSIAIVPTLGPLEEDEELLSEEYVRRYEFSRRSHRMFRNIWYRKRDGFDEFKRLVHTTWPEMHIKPPEMQGYGSSKLMMFCEENRTDREITWAGFGFQIWLQLLTHLLGSTTATTLIIDEPEIYLHPDLQHKLFQILRDTKQQIILATHSVEIVNEAEHDEVVLINRSRQSAKRVGDIEGLQEALFTIGSAQNIHLAKLSRDRKILFFEGDDYKILKRFAGKAGLTALANDVSLTVVPIGGFTQHQRITEAAWTFQKVLRADIAIAALLDRDYRCPEEIDTILSTVRSSVPKFHVLGRKEIENYLLDPEAILRAVNHRLKDRERAQSQLSESDILSILNACADEFKSDVGAQLASHRSTYLKGKRDPATIMAETLRKFESDWSTFDEKIKLVPGKLLMTSLNRRLQQLHQISITPAQIISHMTRASIPKDLNEILTDFNSLVSQPI